MQTTKRQFCTFWLCDRLFGVDILDIKEINQDMTFTHVYHAAEEIIGMVNIRGHIHMVIDLPRLIGLGPTVIDKQCSIVIFKTTVADSLGVLVGRICGVIEVDQDSIETISSSDGSQLLVGVSKLDDFVFDIIDPRCFMTIGIQELAAAFKDK